MRKILLWILLLPLAGCLPFDYAPPPPTPEHVSVAYTPALSGIINTIHACALSNPKIAITTQVLPLNALEIGVADVILKLGPAPEGQFEAAYVTLLGQEQIVAIASPNIAPGQIEIPDVKILYTSLVPEYQVWQYPEGSELREIFDMHVLSGDNTTPQALMAPDPEAMLTSVSRHPNSVGYIPTSMLPAETTLSVSDAGAPQGFVQPVLGYTSSEPGGLLREFLHCLSETLP